MSTKSSDPFGSAMGKYLMRLKYEKLDQETTIVIDHNDQEINDKSAISELAEINLKLIKFKALSNIKPKILWTFMYLQRVRDAYVEAMHRFAGHFMQLNNGTNAYSFKNKVTCSP